MVTRRDEICSYLKLALSQISKTNGYYTDFDRSTYWQATPTQYEQNHLNFRDESEDYDLENTKYDACLPICIEAVVIETPDNSAADLGTLALKDIMKAVRNACLPATLFNFKRSHKYVEHKGKTAALVELEIEVKYKF